MGDSLLLLLFIILTVTMGYAFRFLTLSGSIAAGIVGVLTMLGFHIKGLLVLGVFFATSSFWSYYKKVQKLKVEERLAKGSRRDWQQVLANGGSAAAASFLYYLNPDPLWLLCFCMLIAGANSDTWASEIGTLSKRQPISIRTMSVVQKGTSGAVSVLGTGAALAGAFLIALISYYLFEMGLAMSFFVFIFGFLGNLIDTIFGAYLQAMYRCRNCNLDTEKLVHCGQKTERLRGLPILNNEMVNFLSCFLAATIGAIIYTIMK